MGAEQTHSEYDEENWLFLENVGKPIIMENRKNAHRIELHVSHEPISDRCKEIYDWRKQFKQNSCIVTLHHYEIQNDIFGSQRTCRAYTEELTRLSKISSLSKAEGLFLMREIIKGLQLLYSQFGLFLLSAEAVGINQQGQPKIWLNDNFSKNSPQKVNDLQTSSSNFQLLIVNNLVRIIRSKVYNNESTLDYPSSVDFEEALQYIEDARADPDLYCEQIYLGRGKPTENYLANQLSYQHHSKPILCSSYQSIAPSISSYQSVAPQPNLRDTYQSMQPVQLAQPIALQPASPYLAVPKITPQTVPPIAQEVFWRNSGVGRYEPQKAPFQKQNESLVPGSTDNSIPAQYKPHYFYPEQYKNERKIPVDHHEEANLRKRSSDRSRGINLTYSGVGNVRSSTSLAKQQVLGFGKLMEQDSKSPKREPVNIMNHNSNSFRNSNSYKLSVTQASLSPHTINFNRNVQTSKNSNVLKMGQTMNITPQQLEPSVNYQTSNNIYSQQGYLESDKSISERRKYPEMRNFGKNPSLKSIPQANSFNMTLPKPQSYVPPRYCETVQHQPQRSSNTQGYSYSKNAPYSAQQRPELKSTSQKTETSIYTGGQMKDESTPCLQLVESMLLIRAPKN